MTPSAPTVLPADLSAQVRAVYGLSVTHLEIEVVPGGNGLDGCLALQGDQPLSPTRDAAWRSPARRMVLTLFGVTTPQAYAQVLADEGEDGTAFRAELEEVIVFGADALGQALRDLIGRRRLRPGTHRLALTGAQTAPATVPAPGPERISVVISTARVFGGEGPLQTVHLDRRDLGTLRAAVEAWGAQVQAAHADVPLLTPGRFDPAVVGRMIRPPQAEFFCPDVDGALAALAQAGLGERCAYVAGHAEEEGVTLLDPAALLWTGGSSMTRVKGPGELDCFLVL